MGLPLKRSARTSRMLAHPVDVVQGASTRFHAQGAWTPPNGPLRNSLRAKEKVIGRPTSVPLESIPELERHFPMQGLYTVASTSYRRWRTTRASALDEIARAHAAIGGTARGRRFTTQQINQAYAMLLASQFQGFCRDLHSESVDPVVAVIAPPARLRNLVMKGGPDD